MDKPVAFKTALKDEISQMALLFSLIAANIVLFFLSTRTEHYACEECRSLGTRTQLRIIGFAATNPEITVIRSLDPDHTACKHQWRCYHCEYQGLIGEDYRITTRSMPNPWEKWVKKKR